MLIIIITIALILLIKQCPAVFIELMETLDEEARKGAPNEKTYTESFNSIETPNSHNPPFYIRHTSKRGNGKYSKLDNYAIEAIFLAS